MWIHIFFVSIQHKLKLKPGAWHAHVRAKNAVGWSLYSDDTIIDISKGNRNFRYFRSENESRYERNQYKISRHDFLLRNTAK